MQAILSGKDCLALMPTGGGKSLCYQVPAMAKPGLCLVVSPLIALMRDQVENLRKKGITAFSIFSGMKRYEVIKTLKTACESNCKFLYVSPERLETALFKEYLPALDISLIAVDEAHCISQWGYDFRPAYLRIALLREELPHIPVLALTASATPEVQQDITEKLLFKNSSIFRQSFERSNLSYSVFKVGARINKLVEILNNVPGSSIVYCKSRRRTREIAAQLQSYNIAADCYHAGLSAEERNLKQAAWIENKNRTIVCTNAFGMGIDKPDVRSVVHFDPPDCLENYYQEAGRAGRDGKKSFAVLLYQQEDLAELQEQVNQRFPDITTIRSVYQAIANYLQLPQGSGEGNYFDFDLTDFLKKFNLPAQSVINCLKVLEQESFLSFNEQVFIPAKAQFICNKQWLYQFEKENEALEPLIKLLLRTYEGIFDRPVAIFEKQLAGWLKISVALLQQDLNTLHRYHIISYDPQKDKPQLYFLQPRVVAENLSFNYTNYLERKKRFEARVDQFIHFIENGSTCRSLVIGNYFGDSGMKECGICDNCLNKKKDPVSEKDFNATRDLIFTALSNGPIALKDLLVQLKDIKKEKAWQVLDFLVSEKKISMSADGLIVNMRY
jgi:ATP-dependent DNA helicase RecQ